MQIFTKISKLAYNNEAPCENQIQYIIFWPYYLLNVVID